MQFEQLYQDIILDHYKHPHGRGLAGSQGNQGDGRVAPGQERDFTANSSRLS